MHNRKRGPLFIAVLALGAISASSASASEFQLANNYTVNPYPTGIVTGDFNRDGHMDLAVAVCGDADCISTGSVQVLLGNGNGTFTPGGLYVAGPDGTVVDTMAAGDFNGDGVPDIVAVNSAINEYGTVSVLLGDGMGGFLPPVSYAVNGAVPVWAAVGDFNGDGKVDLAISVTTTAVISVLLGNGDGTFQPAIGWPVDSGVQGIVVGDMNNDGKLDIVTANECGNDPNCRLGTISVLLGNGDGTFQPELSFFAGMFPLSVGLGDFNHDGHPDVAVALPCGTDPTCVSVGGIGVLLGNGDGSLQPVVNYPSTGYGTVRLIVGDFNRDRRSDVMAADYQQTDVTVFLANRNGTLQNGVPYTVSQGPVWMALGDFNGDRSLDVAVANEYGADVSVLLNTGGTYVSLSSNPNPSKAGQPVTFTATVASSIAGVGVPTGQVTFTTGSGNLGNAMLVNGSASFTYSGFAAGIHWIHALYSGDATFNRNRSVRMKQIVEP